jgi:hypothetical protein
MTVKKVKVMSNDRLRKQVWTISCPGQEVQRGARALIDVIGQRFLLTGRDNESKCKGQRW